MFSKSAFVVMSSVVIESARTVRPSGWRGVSACSSGGVIVALLRRADCGSALCSEVPFRST